MTRAERTELAELLSGTSDKKTRAYKSARRQVERWNPIKPDRRPQRPTRSQGRLQLATRTQRIRNTGANVRFQIQWYEGRAPEWVPANTYLAIPGDVMREAEGNPLALWTAFLVAYNVPNVRDWLQNVRIIETDVRPR